MIYQTLLLLTIVSQPFPTSEKKKTDLDKFQGTWNVVLAKTIDGNPDLGRMNRKVKIVGNKMEFFNKAGQPEGKITLFLDPQKSPKQFNGYMIKGREKISLPGIYSFEKNQLWLCWSASRERPSRPTDFEKIGGDEEFRVFILEPLKE